MEVLQQQHAQEVGALAGEVQQLADSRRATAEALQAEMDSAQGEAAARLEELEAQIQLLQNDNYDVITCITQESDKVGGKGACLLWGVVARGKHRGYYAREE